MRTKISAVLLAALASATAVSSTPAQAALSFCLEPRAPHFYSTKPSKPYCATSRSCSDWEVNSYKREVESYFNELRSYADEVDKYYKKQGEYIQCMADLD